MLSKHPSAPLGWVSRNRGSLGIDVPVLASPSHSGRELFEGSKLLCNVHEKFFFHENFSSEPGTWTAPLCTWVGGLCTGAILDAMPGEGGWSSPKGHSSGFSKESEIGSS